jgi:GNAT superfamily N-acetyltransferase
MEWTRGAFSISTDPARLDREVIHRFLSTSYWAPDVPREIVDRSIENSMAFGLYENGSQVGFARVITDKATFAYLADVFVLESHRGRGLALWLMETIRAHPALQNMRRWALFTRDAHPLYRKVGFKDLENDPPRCMEIIDRGIYARMKNERP